MIYTFVASAKLLIFPVASVPHFVAKDLQNLKFKFL